MIYHVYNRGAHKADIFHDRHDYERFIELLYLGNNIDPVNACKAYFKKIFNVNRSKKFVDIYAYCLMPNYFHIALEETDSGGITKFLRKVLTAYSMYYNFKYDHLGTIFQGRAKAKIIDNDRNLGVLINYIHLNPYKLQNPEITTELMFEQLEKAVSYCKKYEYSSLKDYFGEKRPERNILKCDLSDLGGLQSSDMRLFWDQKPYP